jgi:ABC-type branched-subunit amino acid transport system substrate-binding protein
MPSRSRPIPALLRPLAIVAALVLAACAPRATVGPFTGPAVDPNAPVRVALLVPLGSGDPGREQIGRSLVNAAQLAQSDLRNATIDLRIYETAGTSEGGAAAASAAVNEGAQIIVGPLFSTATAAAGPIAQQAGLNVLSFSNNATVAGGNVYLLGLTFENTADRLVSYSMSRGLSNFGVVYPRGLEGDTARNAVTNAIRTYGGTLATSQSYDLSVEGIRAAVEPMAAALTATGANAVVLTDGPTGGLTFVSESLRGLGVSSTQAQFLGMQRWDTSAEALNQPSLQGGWFAAPDPALLAAFEGRYQGAYGERPHELAGLAYDGIAAVGALIADARARGANDPFAAERLTQPAGFAGVNGAFRFTPSGLSQRALAMLEVQGGRAVVIDGAPRTFAAVGN